MVNLPSMTDNPKPGGPWPGNLTLTPGTVIYAGPGGKANPHSHHAIQFIRSFTDPFELRFEDETVTCTAAIVPSGVEHGFSSNGDRLLLALIEPLGPRGADLNELALSLDHGQIPNALPAPEAGADDPQQILRSSIETLLPGRPNYPHISPHVEAALLYLDETIENKPRLEEAARSASISPSRLSHLFTEEIGIPFRNFVLWLRLRRVVEEVTNGANLTEAAHTAGFSDSPHLSRVFREHFGLSPSALLGMRVDTEGWPA